MHQKCVKKDMPKKHVFVFTVFVDSLILWVYNNSNLTFKESQWPIKFTVSICQILVLKSKRFPHIGWVLAEEV